MDNFGLKIVFGNRNSVALYKIYNVFYKTNCVLRKCYLCSFKVFLFKFVA